MGDALRSEAKSSGEQLPASRNLLQPAMERIAGPPCSFAKPFKFAKQCKEDPPWPW
jgi:hypothetical protein